MKRKFGWFIAAAIAVAFSVPAAANNDCCWDWSPGERGEKDGYNQPPKKLGSEPDPPNAPFGWAECTPTSKAGENGGKCFDRYNRQMYWEGWTCLVGTPAPNGAIPGPGNGYQCEEKKAPGTSCFQPQQLPDPFDPMPPGPTIITIIEDPNRALPAASTVGLVALVGLILAGAAWLFRKPRVAGTNAPGA